MIDLPCYNNIPSPKSEICVFGENEWKEERNPSFMEAMWCEEEHDICELFPAMTLVDVKLKPSSMKLEPQIKWRNFIGVDYRSFYRVVEKKKRIDGVMKKSGIGL